MTSISNPTVITAADLWLKRCRLDGLERATLRSYKGHITHHIEPKIGDLLLEELTTATIRDFLDDMLEVSSRSMTIKVLASLRSILSEAQTRDLIEHNVAREVKLRRASRVGHDRVIPTKSEIKALLKNVPHRHKPLIVTMIFTGMRASELRGLRWKNVDMDKHIIRVCERADRYNDMGPPKSKAGYRYIPMTPMVYKVLSEWRASCPKGNLGLVFPNGVGNIESHANIYHRIFKPLIIASGIVDDTGKPRFGIHSLRHAAASLFIEQGWSAKKIQILLGHSSINMTFDVYGHLFHNPEEDVVLMKKLERELFAA